MQVYLQPIGNEMGIVLPQEIVERLGLKENTRVQTIVEAGGIRVDILDEDAEHAAPNKPPL